MLCWRVVLACRVDTVGVGHTGPARNAMGSLDGGLVSKADKLKQRNKCVGGLLVMLGSENRQLLAIPVKCAGLPPMLVSVFVIVCLCWVLGCSLSVVATDAMRSVCDV